MEHLSYRHAVRRRATGSKRKALVGVVASGNLEVLVERVLPDYMCEVDIRTAAAGFGDGPPASARASVNMVYVPMAARPHVTVRNEMSAIVFIKSGVLRLIQVR